MPTETVYGLAAAEDDPAARERLYAAKGRPREKPIALLAAGPEELARFGAVLSPAARQLAARFWPGPLTLVLDSPAGWLGFRVPAHPVMQALLRRWGGVLAVTSANRSDAPPARTAQAALAALAPFVALALDAGPADGGVPSTVVRVDGARVELLRAGAIAEEEIIKNKTTSAPSGSRRILLVCTGNVCRSPMAEYILRARLGPESGWTVCSAGLAAGRELPASPEAVQVCAELKVDLGPHRSQPVTRALAEQAQWMVGMTAAHCDELVHLFPDLAPRIRLMKSFGLAAPAEDIPDPIGASLGIYRHVRGQIESALSDLILFLREQAGPPPGGQEKKHSMKMALGADHGGYELKEVLKQKLLERHIEVEDVGALRREPGDDYPDFGRAVAERVAAGQADQGLLICTTGIGMSIAANRYPGVRAALCADPHVAEIARQHNNANVLVLGGAVVSPAQAAAILDVWLATDFERGGRHERRVGQLDACAARPQADPELSAAIADEARRQRENLELIASENYVSAAVRAAQGSVLTNKYAEGYPGKRWYNGCEFVDVAERLAIERARRLFGAEHANVQPHCGSSANMAVYFAMLQPGDTILAMSLAHGGHLTHGHKVNFSGRFFNIVPYGVDQATEQLDYEVIAQLAREHKPKLLLAGASAYARLFDFPRLRAIADEVGALLMVDMAHFAGLVAGGCHPNPVPYCDFVTSTTHKTLRGPRGGLILCREKYAADIDRQIFPGIQGGPLEHVIAAKAVCFHEALQPAFQDYARQIVANARALAAALAAGGLRIVSGGTDNHLMLVDLNPIGVTGKDAATALDQAHITVNKNAIPFDTKSPFVTSGIRVGTPAVTTRGMREPEMELIAAGIRQVLAAPTDEKVRAKVRDEVLALTARFPVP